MLIRLVQLQRLSESLRSGQFQMRDCFFVAIIDLTIRRDCKFVHLFIY